MKKQLIREVGAFEAKTRLSELLRDAQSGVTYVIRRRGKVVARLLPPEMPKPDWAAALAGLARIRSKIKGKVDVRKLIDEGRRF